MTEVLAWKCPSLSKTPLKHRGLADFPIMMGFSLSPLAFTKKAQVSLSFDLFPPVQLPDACDRDLFGKALKNCPVSSMFHMFSGAYPCKSSGSLSFQESTVSSRTSPASPEMNLALIPFLLLKRSSHPFEALNSSCEMSNPERFALPFLVTWAQ